MKGAATNTEGSYSSMPCQHVHSQQQTTTSSTTIITSTTAHNNSKTLDNSSGLMMTKCIKGEHCTASGCAGNVTPGNVSGCSSNAAKK